MILFMRGGLIAEITYQEEKPMKIVKCESCGKIAIIVQDSACPTKCCGEPMTELVAGAVDAAKEKHVPVIAKDGNLVTVTVGSVEHPMIPEHYIQFIILETSAGYQKKDLKPGEKPAATFALAPGETAVAASEYCSRHGLWKAEA